MKAAKPSHEYKPIFIDGKYNPDLEFISAYEKRWKETSHGLDSPSLATGRFGTTVGEYISEMERELGSDGKKLMTLARDNLDVHKKFEDLTIGEYMLLSMDDMDYCGVKTFIDSHFSLDRKVFENEKTARDMINGMREGSAFGILLYSYLYPLWVESEQR